MKTKLVFFALSCLLIASCDTSSKLENKEISDPNISKTQTSNDKWMSAINAKDIQSLKSLYTESVYVLSKNGIDIENRKDLLELVKKSDFVVKNVETKKRIKANDTYDYEIGTFTNKNGDLMKHLIIWKTSDGRELRELEFLAEVNSNAMQMDVVDEQRTKWMNLCNAHDTKSLIQNMYTKNTMYYNRGRLLKGRESLIKEYQYMNDSSYNLTLKPILVEPVSDTIMYEFGQCKGSYNGKYILVWQKNAEGIWQILFDSNI